MGTSLAEQLKKLRAPQTGLLLQDKKRPSLLFDQKEAANLDRETVLNIGQSGLKELIKLSDVFLEYESSLFAQSSLNFERSVQSPEVNRKLDASIEKFFILLSPYFLLNTAHKALEWLICRYRVHQFNKDQLLLLILPYHETRIFVRALQLLNLTDPGDKWHWLKALQKPGVPLASVTLINRVASDNALLKLLCNHVILATKTYAERASTLSTLYAFYTSAIVGGIDRASTITDVQVNHILPALIKGLGSNVPDFAASCYMIFAKLVTRAKLNAEIAEKLLLKTFKHPQLHQEAVLLLIFLYESPYHRLTAVSRNLVIRLCEHSWFVDVLVKIQSSRCRISRFIVPFLQAACQTIWLEPGNEETTNVRNTISGIISRVNLEDDDVDIILSTVVAEFLQKTDAGEEGEEGEELAGFPVEFYRSLEKAYPLRFDDFLKNLMRKSESDTVAKSTLQFVTSWHFGAKGTKESADILDGLLHVTPEQRMLALDTLRDNDVDVPESFRETMTHALLARFSDNEIKVVKSLLSIPVKRLTRLFPVDTLTDELTLLLTTCHTAARKALAKPALKILLELCEDGDDTSVFIASLPYLFPTTDEDVAIAMEVLRSNFAKGNKYMQQVRKDVGERPNAEAMTSAAFHNVLNWQLLPPTASILSAMKQHISHGDATSMFFNMILLGSVCRVHVGSLPPRIGREVIEMATEMIKKYPRIKLVKDCNNITGNNIKAALELTSRGILPLQVGTYVLEMVHRRLDLKARPKFDFEDDADYSNLVLRLLEMFFDGINNEFRSRHYKRCLQIFFQRHFSTVKDLIHFLSQLFAKPVNVQTSFHCLKICSILLNRCNSTQWAFHDKVLVTNLLLALSRENNECRSVALDIVKTLIEEDAVDSEAEPFAALLRELAERSAEISLDPEQLTLYLYTLLSPDPDVSSQLKSNLRGKLQRARKFLYDYILDPECPMHTRSQLFDVLAHVNGPDIVERLAPLGLQLLEKFGKEEPKRFAGNALKNILQRFNATAVRALKNESVWTFFEKSLHQHQIQIETEAGPQSPSVILLRQIDDAFFDSIGKHSPAMQEKIFVTLVDIATDSEISSVVSRASKVLRRIRVDARLVIGQLQRMNSGESSTDNEPNKRMKRRSLARAHASVNPTVINSREWKRGVTLLEFVQRATNIENEELLYPTLFSLLKSCLSFEEQSPVEYTNQLLLSTIHRLAVEKLPIRDAHLQIDIITQCIRTSRNPQTHHHALLVLVELLKMVDVRCAMHTIMPIFTFMGSSVVRQDDAYSIQIISKTIDTVLPIVNAANNEAHVCEILRTFIVSLPDIPEHRRIPLFVKLLQLLEDHLHLYYLLTFESHVLSGTMRVASQQQSPQQRLEFALSVSREFSVECLIRSCMKILRFMRELPVDIENESDRKAAAGFPHKHVFDVAGNTPKHLRHYKYILVQFVGRLLSAPDTINRVAELDSGKVGDLRKYYDGMIVELVLLLRSASKCADVHQGKPIGKYWKILLHHLYDVLDLVNNLLPNGVFLGSVKNLIGHDSLVVKRKALELLNVRLQQRKFSDEDHAALLELVGSLMEMIDGTSGKHDGQESEVLQQTALIGVKLLGKLLAGEHPTIFKPVLEMATELLKTTDGPVLGSAALCVAELCTSMRTYAIQSLNKFVPAILRLLETHCQQDGRSDVVVVVGIVSALQKIVESVGNFLSLYLDQLLLELARLNSLYTDVDHSKIGIIVSRLRATAQKLSTCVPLRVLLPAVSRTYDCLLTRRSYECVAPLMRVLAESFNVAQPADLNAAITELTAFFLKVFQLREDVVNTIDEESNHPTLEDIVAVEGAANEAFVAFILKLSEATFRPVYYKLYDWAARNPLFKQRNVTFFRLSANIADRLKSLFVLFAGHFLKHAATLLDSNNLAISRESPSEEFTLAEETDRTELTEAILLTLLRVFTYDAHNFVDQERFETLAQPIVDQIENTQGDKDDYTRRASELIVPCIGAFANAIPDDSLHKRLVYQTLLKTRHAKPNVRTTALNALVEIARKLGEDFMPLLPETVPFLAELLEDEDETAEKSAQEAVRTLEEILGEPLQKYF